MAKGRDGRADDPEFTPPPRSEARALRAVLADWFDENKRDLPWRRTRDPYGIWISEAMLQQTRVEVVLDYWPRFLEAFPSIEALSVADEERVLEVWSGLGYYRRARALQAAAREMVAAHGGAFPRTRAEALALPGVGPYTAGAVLSIAYGLPEALVDGNVERVLARLFALDGARGSGGLQRATWAAARFLAGISGDGVEPRVWNQALMELGALVCTPRSPRCGVCPARGACEARRLGAAEDLPRAKPRKARVDVELEVYVVRDGDRVLLTRRPEGGRMAGMWEFPTIETTRSDLFPREVEGWLGARFEPEHELFELGHGITHHRIRARVRGARAGRLERLDRPEQGRAVVTLAQAGGLALTGMARKVLARLDSGAGTLFA